MLTWDDLEQTCRACRRCGLAEGRTNVVFGVGNREADVMFVGEGPGYYEDQQGEPFVGRAGQLLDKMLASIGLDRQKVYIANIVKCRPPENRDPLPEEQECCLTYLRAQFALIRPKILVCLGRISAKVIIDKNFSITNERGLWFERKGVWMTATFHPAALLRDEGKKPLAWEDMKAIREKLKELDGKP